MSLIVSGGNNIEFEKHPAGVFPARCTRIIDLGTHNGEFKGKAKKIHKIRFAFETTEKMTEGEYAGKPFIMTGNYTASLSDKAIMRKLLESWRGRPFTPQELDRFDLKNVLGKGCLLNVIHSDPSKSKDGKSYANISTVMPLAAGMTAPEAQGELIFFSLQDFNAVTFDKLPERTRQHIAESDEYKAMFKGGKPAPSASSQGGGDMDDDIPF